MPLYLMPTVLTVPDNPPLADPSAGRPTLAGYAALIARVERDQHRFEMISGVLAAFADEPALLTRLADTLPMPDHIVGWSVRKSVVDPLLRVAEKHAPPLRHHAEVRVARLTHLNIIDLSLTGNGNGPATLADAAALLPSVGPLIGRDELLRSWHFGNTARLELGLRAEAIALWRLFLSAAPRACGE